MLRNMVFLDAFKAFIVGDQGLVLYTNDGGISWFDHSISITDTLESITFVDDMNAWVCGQNGVIYHTTDGGDSWVQQQSNTNEWLYTIQFTDLNNGWAAGEGGTLLYTEDGGITWNWHMITFEGLHSLMFVDADNAWLVGNSGTILHTGNGAAVSISDILIEESLLTIYNYPNPAKDETSFVFTLEYSSRVKLSIAALTGHEIAVVINEWLDKGERLVNWDISNLPAGIYFCRLTAGDKYATCKMVVVD